MMFLKANGNLTKAERLALAIQRLEEAKIELESAEASYKRIENEKSLADYQAQENMYGKQK